MIRRGVRCVGGEGEGKRPLYETEADLKENDTNLHPDVKLSECNVGLRWAGKEAQRFK